MADDRALNPEEFRKIGEESTSILTSLNDISQVINDNARNLSQATQDSAASFKTSFSASKKLGEELSRISAKDLKDRKFRQQLDNKVKAAERELLANKRKQAELAIRAKTARGREKAVLETLLQNYQDAAEASRAQLSNTKQLYKELDRIDRDVRVFDDIADLVKDVPLLSKVFKDFQSAADKARAASAEGEYTFREAAKEYTKTAEKAITAFGIKTVVQGIKLGNELTVDFARNLNASAEAARELRTQVTRASISNQGLANAKDYAEIITQVSKTFGISARLSNNQLKTLGLLTKELGLSGESAQKLLRYAALTNREIDQQSKSIIGQTLLANDRNKVNIRYQDVLNDIGTASTATLLTLEKFPGGVQKAAYETRRFGLSLANVSNIAEGLLDFESSISAELEAELLTGKQLNLERARMAALTGDTATLAKEISANFGTAAEFQNMNVIAQNAFAKSLGMTRDELADVYAQQAAINKLSNVEGATLEDKVKTQQKEIRELRAKGQLIRANKLEQQLINDLGDTELRRQLENKSAAEATRRAIESLAEAMAPLGIILEPIAKLFQVIGQGADYIARAILKVVKLIKGLKETFKLFGKDATKVSTAIMKDTGTKVSGAAAQSAVKAGTATATKYAAKEVAKQGAKLAAGQAAKKIPILGSLVNFGFAIDKGIKGDAVGAGLEVLAGLANLGNLLVPGAGTAASMGIDAISVTRDIKRAKDKDALESQPQAELATGGIITRPTKALVGEAGAEAVVPLNEFYGKMDEMIQAVREGKIINMNGYKVGETLALSSVK